MAKVSPYTPHALEELEQTGIYKIQNKVNGRFYIGSASVTGRKTFNGFRTRWTGHIYYLNKGNHKNKILQQAWNKYGGDKFEFSIIEVCEPDLCLEKEQYYLDFYWNSELLYNTNPFVDSPRNPNRDTEYIKQYNSRTKAKTYTLQDPEGNIVTITNMKKFCEEKGLAKSRMYDVAKGKQDTHAGWSRIGYVPPEKHKLLSPNGKLYEFDNIKNFAKEHNLIDCNLVEVLNKNRKHHKGWSRPDSPYKPKEYKVKSPEGKIYTFTNKNEFCRIHNLNSTHIANVIKGKLKHHKRWTAA